MTQLIKHRPVTFSVTALCLIIYLVTLLLGTHIIVYIFQYPHPRNPETFLQLWRYFTPALIHFSHLHIAFNLIFWWILASLIERVRGSGRLLGLLFLIAVISNTAQYVVSNAPFGGLSGVVYGLFGYVWIYGKLSRWREIAAY